MSYQRPIIAITVGDPAGIGPEIAVKAVARNRDCNSYRPLLVAEERVVKEAASRWAPEHSVRTVVDPKELDGSDEQNVLWVYDTAADRKPEEAFSLPAQGSVQAGQAAHDYLAAGISMALAGDVSALVTGPLNKEALSRAGWVGVGHTELLADYCGVERKAVAMMLASERLRVAHVSTHIPLREAIESLSQERIVTVAELTGVAVERMIGRRPRLAVAGVNPHAGEGGLFGQEEITTIKPAVTALLDAGWQAEGPVSPDTVFARALNGEFDAVIAMYHDQGHIPSKLVGFHDTVNITLGLPIIRVSVDHGTAYDIAWRGGADEANMVRAIEVATQMSRRTPR